MPTVNVGVVDEVKTYQGIFRIQAVKRILHFCNDAVLKLGKLVRICQNLRRSHLFQTLAVNLGLKTRQNSSLQAAANIVVEVKVRQNCLDAGVQWASRVGISRILVQGRVNHRWDVQRDFRTSNLLHHSDAVVFLVETQRVHSDDVHAGRHSLLIQSHFQASCTCQHKFLTQRLTDRLQGLLSTVAAIWVAQESQAS